MRAATGNRSATSKVSKRISVEFVRF